MIFVDTSVWIDFFANKNTTEVILLVEQLGNEESICYSGVILQELMQGISKEKQRKEVEENFLPFIEIFPTRSTYLLAAELYRKSKSKGHPIRSSADCLIAACCIEQGCTLLEKDRDFLYLQKVSSLKLLR